MKAKSIKGKSAEEIRSQLEQIIADGFKPTLAIVFLSISQDRKALSKILEDAGIKVFGATSNGEFIDEEYTNGGIAILLLNVAPSCFFIEFAPLNGTDDRQTAAALAKEAKERFANPAFLIVASNLSTDAESLLAGFADVLGSNESITGGMAGDDHQFTGQYVFTSQQEGDRAILCLVFDGDRILVKGQATHGWRAFGTEKVVTKSEGNRLYTIDNIPAVDVCLRFSGLAADDPNLATELVMNCPFQLKKENGETLMRPAYHINWEDHSVLTSGCLPVGSRIKFSLPPDFDVIEKVVEEAKSFKETTMPEADALILFNCGGRLMCFGPLIGEEIKGLKEIWNIPMAGMFSNAEIGKTKLGHVEMHNLTASWVTLKEK